MRHLVFPILGGIVALGTAFAATPASAKGGSSYLVCQRVSPGPPGAVTGSGRLVRQNRMTAAFDQISLDGAAELDIVVGPQLSVEVETDENLSHLIRTDVRDGRL